MYNMTAFLQVNSEKCLYEQIYEHIRDEIRGGELRSGERLPSTRVLADYLQVSRNTVDLAYDQLLSEGYIESRERKGYFACAMEQYSLPELPGQAELSGRMQAGKELSGQQAGEALPKYNFHPNGMDMSLFPYSVWRKINKNILNDENSDLFALGEAQGDYDLRKTISHYLYSSRGVNCAPEQIIVGAGNDYLLLLLEKILGRHTCIAMENPTYKRAYQIFESFAYSVELVGMDENGMKASDLYETNAKAAYVMPSHQYPTGITMPIGRRMELLKWAKAGEERYLIEDDYDSEFRYRGKPIPALQGVDKHDKVIYIGTFSKAIAPAIRISFMVLPEKLLQVYRENCGCYSSTVSRIDQRILNEFIKGGYFERYLNKARKLYREKHDCLLQGLKPFGKKFALSGEDTGLHILLTCKDSSVTEEELVKRAEERDVKVYPLSAAYIAPVKREHATIMLGYGGLSLEEIEEGLERLREVWEV